MTAATRFSLIITGLVLFGWALAQAASGNKPTKATVTVAVSGNGLVTSSAGGISCPSTCSGSVNVGTSVTFTAAAVNGSTFTGWGGSCAVAGAASTCTLTVSDTVSITASFTGGSTATSELDALRTRVAALEAILANVSRGVDPATNEDTLFFDNMNVAVRNGSGPGTVNGRGNLIIGYNEKDDGFTYHEFMPLPQYVPPPPLDVRTGSHNLVIGPWHSYTGHSGIIAGFNSKISGRYGAVIAGQDNVASGLMSFVAGGEYNSASGSRTSVFGGERNDARARYSSILGGGANITNADFSNIIGAIYSQTSGGATSLIVGGAQNTVTGKLEVIVGGDQVTCDDGDTVGDESRVCGEGSLSPPDSP